MGVNVSYKGSVITSFNSDASKILNTAGKFMEDNILIDGILSVQNKSITPSTSSQIVIPDRSIIVMDNYTSDTFTTVTGSGIDLDIETTNIPTYTTYPYCKINGYIQIQESSARIQCTNIIIPLNGDVGTYRLTTWSTVEAQGVSIVSGSTYMNGDVKNITFYYNTTRIFIGISFDTYGTQKAKLENFTCVFGTSENFLDYDYLGQVTVNPIPSNYVVPTGTIQISGNGTYDVSSYASAEVSTSSTINNQNKTVTPSESQQTISADSGYTGLGTVTVNAISNTYVGTGITRRSSSDLSASGATVTVPAGYYASQATKSVSTTTHPDPTASINTSTGLVTASHTQTAGYVSAGTTTGTLQLTTQAAATITPTTSSQTAVAAGRYTTGAVTVAAIPSNYVDASSLKTYYTGSSAPSSSLGSNGDLYFQTSEA